MDGELVPAGVSKRDLRYEANLRAHKAGYDVTRDGKPKPRRICTVVSLGQTRLNLWPRDETGNLIE